MDNFAKPSVEIAPGLTQYRRIELDLRRRLGDGMWPVGAMLPSRRDLARQYSVSLVTLDRAIGPLLADGLLRADDRRGTFAARLPTDSENPARSPGAAGEPAAIPDIVAFSDAPYAPHPAAKSLRIGVTASIPRETSQEYYIVREVEQLLSLQGHVTVFVNRTHEMGRPHRLRSAIQSLLDEGVDAMILVCLDLDRTLVAEDISSVPLGLTPLVCVLAGEINLPIPHVFYDNRSGGYQAAQHLLARGWRDLTVFAPFRASWVSERIAGIRDALAYAPFAVGPLQLFCGEEQEWSSMGEPRVAGRETAAAALVAGWRPGGGIIGINDGVGFGVLEAIAPLGLTVGKDFALLGFDDDPEARGSGLTSLRPPMQGMAREAVRLALDQVQGAEVSLQVRLRAQLIPRDSTAAPRL